MKFLFNMKFLLPHSFIVYKRALWKSISSFSFLRINYRRLLTGLCGGALSHLWIVLIFLSSTFGYTRRRRLSIIGIFCVLQFDCEIRPERTRKESRNVDSFCASSDPAEFNCS